jgi:hypothetical protein
LLGLQDQVRWQPWVWQFTLMLAAAAAAPDRDHPGLLALYRFIMVAGYFWSGLHKLGPGFQNLLETSILTPLAAKWPQGVISFVRATGPLIPWIEIGLAAALCFRKTRRAGVVAAVLTHLVILAMLGPAGKNENAVVWPWNAVMIALVILLFWRSRELGSKRLFDRGFRLPAAAGITLAGVMPLLSRAELWDRYFSFQLYSGTDRRFVIIVDEKAAAALPAEYQARLDPSTAGAGLRELRFLEWSLDELRVPFPAEKRNILAMGKKFAAMDFTRAGEVVFYTDFQFLLDERGWDIHTPQEMLALKDLPPLRRKYEPRPD